ncbi:uroporphyrinogen-III synthase [Nocardioides litoris]|uniref:uroporphyrinogen-III synthase n=1 Tax=Nocardioides litoris TaxID=1926648 RepID=UPI002482DBF3|nr:uroporphyrinogen-III synthase [Nocardioides litoris]
MSGQPLAGCRVGVTAGRKVEEQVVLLERRGAEAVHAPALSERGSSVDPAELRAATAEALAAPVDVFVATTGVGMRTWFAACEDDGTLDALLARLGAAEVLARGPKSVGALRQRGLREAWSPESEALDDVLAHLHGRDLTGVRVVLQEHGLSLSSAAQVLRERGAEVVTVPIYRTEPAADLAPLRALAAAVADRTVDAVTFTSAPAVAVLMATADEDGRGEEVAAAFRDPRHGVVACCVGPVCGAAFAPWGVPWIAPDRSRLVAMVRALETELLRRRTVRSGGAA